MSSTSNDSGEKEKTLNVNSDLSNIVNKIKKETNYDAGNKTNFEDFVEKKDDVLKEVLILRDKVLRCGERFSNLKQPSTIKRYSCDNLIQIRNEYKKFLDKIELKNKAINSVDLSRNKKEAKQKFEQGRNREEVFNSMTTEQGMKRDSMAHSITELNLLIIGLGEKFYQNYRSSIEDEDKKERMPDLEGYYSQMMSKKKELEGVYYELSRNNEELMYVVASPWTRLATLQLGCLASTAAGNRMKKKPVTGVQQSDLQSE